jgi:hypothetical protein
VVSTAAHVLHWSRGRLVSVAAHMCCDGAAGRARVRVGGLGGRRSPQAPVCMATAATSATASGAATIAGEVVEAVAEARSRAFSRGAMRRLAPPGLHRVNAILHTAQRDTQVALGSRGAFAALHGAVHRTLPPWGRDLYARFRPELRDDAAWDAFKRDFTSFAAKVRGEYAGNARPEWAARPLYWIRVRPVNTDALPTTSPPSSEYHVSLLYYGPDTRDLLRELESAYGNPRVVTLRGRIWGAAFELDPETDPVASDPLVQRANKTGVPLHISL